ncbi:VOC family protein [Chitinimonas arctica]|uniref:VOC family protein n=1 Tax=Chitinimonas arctica TaxID=2594795 RepID=A0A516SIZ1_9NEIS|nr:VOC family protein [Chitinimonas arctica]QDQ28114.1 VOC family protein [Chitinimonas arctica]
MSNKVKPIPEGYHSVTPYLTVSDGKAALDFYQRAFDAKVVMQMPGENGKVMHADILLGNSHVMLSDEFPDYGALSPKTLGGRSGTVMLYVEDVDAVVASAVAAGGVLERPVADQFYGDRVGMVRDPFGHGWHISTHIEDVPDSEMEKRMREWESKNS